MDSLIIPLVIRACHAKGEVYSPFVSFSTMPDLEANARRVLESPYRRRNRVHDLIETPGELFHRVAKAVARAELQYDGTDKVLYPEGGFFMKAPRRMSSRVLKWPAGSSWLLRNGPNG